MSAENGAPAYAAAGMKVHEMTSNPNASMSDKVGEGGEKNKLQKNDDKHIRLRE